jgi:type IV secretory pathway VirB10-like protein
MSMTEIRDADLRGVHTTEPEAATSKSKLLAAAAVILGLAAVGAYAYTSHGILPTTPQKVVVSQPIAMTPPLAQPATQPDVATPAPQAVAPAPEAQAPAPDVKVQAQKSSPKAKATEHVTHVRARAPGIDVSTYCDTARHDAGYSGSHAKRYAGRDHAEHGHDDAVQRYAVY